MSVACMSSIAELSGSVPLSDMLMCALILVGKLLSGNTTPKINPVAKTKKTFFIVHPFFYMV
ncbi:MAG: hypothetical protein N3A01_02390 [Bacteroidales bacterium]|nr:hypothetical protein [Bacteroidales bacterium]